MREVMIDTVNQIFTNSIEHLQYSHYISICLDGGQVTQRHFIDFVWVKKCHFQFLLKIQKV